MNENEILEVTENSEITENSFEEFENPENLETSSSVDYIPYFEDISLQLSEIRDSLQKEEQTEEQTEEQMEEQTEEQMEDQTSSSLTILGSGSGDFNLYFSDKVENATIDDLYSICVSIRNVALLFFLFWIMVILIRAFKSIIYRLINR